MTKFADIFQSSGVPYPMTIKNVDRGVVTKFGTSTVVVAEHEGEEYKWFVDDEKFGRTFPEDVFTGDKITVTKKQHPKNAQWSYYSTQIVERSPNANTQQKRETIKSDSAKDREVTQYRMGLAGVTQALIASGLYSINDPEKVEILKGHAKELMRWIRDEAESMYEEDIASDVDEVFDGQSEA